MYELCQECAVQSLLQLQQSEAALQQLSTESGLRRRLAALSSDLLEAPLGFRT